MKENKKLMVMQEVMVGKKTLAEGARVLGVSERQGWRVLAQVRKKGALGVVHGNRGQESSRRTPDKIREKVIHLRQEEYPGFNDRHFTQELEDQEYVFRSYDVADLVLLHRERRGFDLRSHGAALEKACVASVRRAGVVGAVASQLGKVLGATG